MAAAAAWLLRARHYRQQARARLAAEPTSVEEIFQRKAFAYPYRGPDWYYPPLIAAFVFFAAAWFFGILIALSVALLSATLTWLILQLLRERRDGVIESQLADAIDVIVGAVRTGSSSTVALNAALHASRQPLKTQLETVLGRIRLGDNTREVVNDLARNVPLETFRLFAFTFGVHWEAGGSLAPALRITARSIRDRIEVSRRLRAQTAEMTVSLIMLTLIVYILGYWMWQANPLRMEAFVRSNIGTLTLAGAIMLQAVGFLWVGHLMKFRF